MKDDIGDIIKTILREPESEPEVLRGRVLALSPSRRSEIVARLRDVPAGRRWLRLLLPHLAETERLTLARELLAYAEDLSAIHRDSTTDRIVDALSLADLTEAAPRLAGSNVAGALWRRLSREAPAQLAGVVLDVLRHADDYARATSLSILVLDPFSDVQLSGSARIDALLTALNDANDEVRGIAAEVLADEATERLARELDRLLDDSSERVRMAAWDAAFAVDFASARDTATDVVLNESASIAARRTALSALAAVLSTTDIAPLLEVLVSHPDQQLAEDAVSLLWSYHRNPVIATAAAESPHQSVREVAQRLLHPETGSPAAGGSRPGAPGGSRDIYREMLKGYERQEE